MRHGNKIKKLGRTHAHRKATMAALSTALIEHKRITTTLPKAKALRTFVEPIINRAKEDTTQNRRQVFRRLQSKEAVKSLFGEIAEVLGDRPGGYTRVVKLGQRAGDAAEMAIIELVDFNDVKPEGGSTKRKTRRSRRRSSDDATAAAPAAAPATTEATDADAADDLTKLWGIGPVFAGALNDAGIATFADLADANLDALRAAINAGSETSDEAANEETWSEQARLAVAGDWAGLDAYIETLKEEGGTAHTPPETVPAAEVAEDATAEAEPEVAEADEVAPEADAEATQEAEAVASDAANPDTTGNPQVPDAFADAPEHGDTEQGAAPGTGEPPPEADEETRDGHRG